MNLEQMRRLCMSFPHATEQIQWGADLVFKVGGKMFAVAATEPSPVLLSFKVTPEAFGEFTEIPGVVPAPYLARAKWIGLERWDAIPHDHLAELLRGSYDLVFAGLAASVRKKLGEKPLTRRLASAEGKQRGRQKSVPHPRRGT
jgi:predicted DNA-binding protein (MmcQ/YjbR family)